MSVCNDLHVEVTPVPFEDLTKIKTGEKISVVSECVVKVCMIRTQRFADVPGVHCNS